MHDDTFPETVGGEAPPPPPGPPPPGTPLAEPPPGAPPVAVASEEASLARAAAELDQVEAALARLEDGSSEVCQVCGGPIGRQRLLQNPLLTRCAEHPARNEITGEG